jgi:hypothetical protein
MRSAADPSADPYSTLGVDPRATNAEIRAAYHALVARYHPDRHQGNPLEELAAARMIEINRAYEILSHPERRAAYDAAMPSRGRDASGRPMWTNQANREGGATTGESHGARRAAGRIALIATVIAVLPLAFRLGGGVLRVLGGLARSALEAMEAIRGTPIAAIAALVAVVLLVWVGLWRRRRQRQQRATTRGEDRA